MTTESNMSTSSRPEDEDVDESKWLQQPSVRYRVTASQWEELQKLLDAPPRDLPRLRKLLNEPGVFDVDPSNSEGS